MINIVNKLFGSIKSNSLKKYASFVEKVNKLEEGISKLSDKDAAAKIFNDKIDILVDLKGHTRHNRLAICAMRPAPIQVTYLGYPGTSGAPFFDYAVSDITVTPSHSHKYYEENLVILRNTYCLLYTSDAADE